ncbi:hypothetical protein K9M74_02545 [Candidatus Woesearchaeota archaeon]|nr:hypothetical protein [Candidatus Woesearchaeota archaeon]
MILKRTSLLFLVLLVMIPFVLALPEPTIIHNPYPTFSLAYDENNAPIQIESVQLENKNKLIYPLNQTANNSPTSPWQFNYTSTYYLPNDDYTFTISAIDVNKNPREDIYSFTVDVDSMPIVVLSPQHPLFDTQDFAVGTSLPFNVSIETAADVVCRIRSYTTDVTDLEAEFNRAAFFFNEQSPTSQTTHNITIVANPAGSNTLLQGLPLDYADLSRNDYFVICKQNNLGESAYHAKIVYIGYDATPPEITIDFEPKTIVDFSDVTTTMNLSSSGDLVVCDYNLTGPGDYFKEGSIPGELTSFTNHFSTVTRKFSFNDDKGLYGFNTPFVFNLAANCTNPAGLSSITKESFTIELSNVLHINLLESVVATTEPELVFTTNLNASCRYETDENTTILATTTNKQHLLTGQTFKEGSNSLVISCQSEQGIVETKTFTLAVDVTQPLAPVIGSGTNQCENIMSVLINAPNPEDTVKYNISLYNSTTTNEAHLIHGPDITITTKKDLLYKAPRSVKTKQNSSYTWVITPLDRAGNKGTATKHTVTKVAPDSISCDVYPPTAYVHINKTTSGYEVTFGCRDAETNCTSIFDLVTAALNESCNYSTASVSSYSANPFIFETDKKICYTVFDIAGNNKTKQFVLELDTDQIINQTCSNGFWDVEEEGVDCGGICGSYPPCPDDDFDVDDNQTDDKNESDDDDGLDESTYECLTDYDCHGLDTQCIQNECVSISDEQQGPSLIGLLLLIGGLVLITGGAGYIVYSEKQKQSYYKQKSLQTQNNSAQQQALAAKRLADEKKYLEELKTKREAGDAKRAKISADKKDARSELIDSFVDEKTKSEQGVVPKTNKTVVEDIFGPEQILAQQKKQTVIPQEQAKLDEGLQGDFVPLEDLGSKGKPQTLTEDASSTDVFADLEKITTKQKKEKKDDTNNK